MEFFIRSWFNLVNLKIFYRRPMRGFVTPIPNTVRRRQLSLYPQSGNPNSETAHSICFINRDILSSSRLHDLYNIAICQLYCIWFVSIQFHLPLVVYIFCYVIVLEWIQFHVLGFRIKGVYFFYLGCVFYLLDKLKIYIFAVSVFQILRILPLQCLLILSRKY